MVVYMTRFPIREANSEALSILEGILHEPLRADVHPGSEVIWRAGTWGLRDRVVAQLPGAGYGHGDAVMAAEWASAAVQLGLTVLRTHPVPDLREKVQAALPGQDVTLTAEEEEDED